MEIQKENPLACQVCGDRIGLFSTKVEVQTHMIKIHHDKNLQCFECGKFFDNIIALKIHLRVEYALFRKSIQNKNAGGCCFEE